MFHLVFFPFLKISLQTVRQTKSFFLIHRCVFWIFIWKGSVVFVFSPLFSTSFCQRDRSSWLCFLFNLPAMGWKMWKVCFLAYCSRLWRQYVKSIRLNPFPLCVRTHFVRVHVPPPPLCFSPFSCPTTDGGLSSLFTALWVSYAWEAAWLPTASIRYWWQKLVHEVTATINCGWQSRGGTGATPLHRSTEKEMELMKSRQSLHVRNLRGLTSNSAVINGLQDVKPPHTPSPEVLEHECEWEAFWFRKGFILRLRCPKWCDVS